MSENNSAEKGNTIIVKPGSPLTVEQAEDIQNRTGQDIVVDKGNPKIIPQDRHLPKTDPFDTNPQTKPQTPPSKQ